MSEKHLFKFQQESDYKTAKRNHLILPNISTIVESGNTYINSDFATKETAEAGDIVVYHEEENGTKTVRIMKPEVFDKNDDYWTADSIVVVPFKHTGDGSVRVMALNYASVLTPSEGGNGEAITVGNNSDRIDPTDMCLDFVTFSSYDEQTDADTYGLTEDGNMPSDSLDSSKHNPYDEETNYSQSASQKFLPSPYNNDGSMNNAYHSLGVYSMYNQPFKNMDGRKNTETALKNIGNDSAIYAQTVDQDILLSPTFVACARYSSVLKPCTFDSNKTVEENLETMPWYLPSAGELGYYMARKGRIDYALQQIGKTLPEGDVKLSSSTFKALDYDVVGLESDGKFAFYPWQDGADGMFAIPFCKF